MLSIKPAWLKELRLKAIVKSVAAMVGVLA